MNRKLIENLAFLDVYRDNDILWVSNTAFNALVKINLSAEVAEIVGWFDNAAIGAKALHKRVRYYKNQLFFFPELGRDIAIYDILTGKMKQISVEVEPCALKKTKIADIAIDGTRVWLFPQYLLQPLLVFDMETLELIVLEEWNKQLVPMVANINEAAIFSLVQIHNEVWFPLKNTEYICQYNLQTNEMKYIKFELNGNSFYSISYEEKKVFWLTFSDTSGIMRWDSASGEQQKIYPEGMERWENRNRPPYTRVVCSGQQVYVLPGYSEYIMRVNWNDMCLEKVAEYPKGFYWYDDERQYWPKFQSYSIQDDKIFIYPNAGNMLLVLHTQDNKIEGKEIPVLNELNFERYVEARVEEMRQRSKREDDILFEGHKDELHLVALSAGRNVENNVKQTENFGWNIWKEIKKHI